ncbi:MAG: polynucleotide kinase-phosphatase, partial [Bacteroidota bacterium]
QYRQLRQSVNRFRKEGFRFIYTLNSVEEVTAVQIERSKLFSNRKELNGPFDLIGDVHGCFRELRLLLNKLGYGVVKHRDRKRNYGYTVTPPKGRTAVFVGDLVDRGPASNEVLRLVMSMVEQGKALCVSGNHDAKLLKKLNGRDVQLKHGLAETMAQLEAEPPEFITSLRAFLDGLVSHYVLDDGKLVVAHAGLRANMHGRSSKAVRSFCLYGETTGETDEFGLPVRHNWALDYKGKAMVVYGHTPVPRAEWINNTVDVDTGCVFGGKLTAVRYPEREVVDVPAARVYSEPTRPLKLPGSETVPASANTLLDIGQVQGRFHVETRLRGMVTIPEDLSISALETMSRFAADPRWLVYLPPTMSPSETSNRPDFLEHPAEALRYYADHGMTEVICEEKHMGSRAIIIVGKDEDAILKNFGIADEGFGKILTRTGRPFFKDITLEAALLQRVQDALTKANTWEQLETDFIVLDCELMPWSAKAQSLLKEQYAAVGRSAQMALSAAEVHLAKAEARGLEIPASLRHLPQQLQCSERFVAAYRQYCWPVTRLEDYRIAPFHILATAGKTYFERSHRWHMETIFAHRMKRSCCLRIIKWWRCTTKRRYRKPSIGGRS